MPGWEGAAIQGGLTLLGGLLGGGGSGSSQPPQTSYTVREGSSFSQGGSSSSNRSASQSRSVTNPDFVWGVQSPYLANLYQTAQHQLGAGNSSMATDMMGRASDAFGNLLNPGASPMLDVYRREIQRGLTDNILPSIRREAAGYNVVGGSRQGVAEGLAAQQGVRSIADFASTVYGQDMDRALAAMQSAPALISAGMGIPWFDLQQLAGILGQPVRLGGGGYSTSTSSASGQGSSFQVGGSSDFSESASGPQGFVEGVFPDRLGAPPPDDAADPWGNWGGDRLGDRPGGWWNR